MKSTVDRPLDSYETELLDDLRREVARRAGSVQRTVPARPRLTRARPRRGGWLVLGAVGGAIAAVLAVASMLTPTTAPTPPFTVTPLTGGAVRVTIARAEDAVGLQQALAGAGLVARVDYLPAGYMCGFVVRDGGMPMTGSRPQSLPAAAGGRTFTISRVTSGHVVIELTGPADSGELTITHMTGPVGSCTPTPVLPQTGGAGPTPSPDTSTPGR